MSGKPTDPIAREVARLDRAKTHLDQLVAKTKGFLSEDPYGTRTERNEKRRRYEVYPVIYVSPPDGLSFLAGDFVHNARASLDNIVWALAPRAVRNRKVSFPIFNNPGGFKSEALPMLKGMKTEIIEAIEWCQPYHGDKNIVSAARLRDLHNLWISDKHRAPYVGGCVVDAASYFTFTGPEPHVRLGYLLAEDKPIAWVPFHPSLQDNFKPTFLFNVAFVGSTQRRAVPWYGLVKAYEIITNEVVPAIRRAL